MGQHWKYATLLTRHYNQWQIKVLLSYHPIFLRPYLFLKLVSFLGANRTKSTSVGPQLLRGTV